jgi:Zn-finger nucleic acid-binding protein
VQCPFDATTLQVVNRSGVEIDWCPSCKGVWLERGELDKLIDQADASMAPPPPRTAPPPAPTPAPMPTTSHGDPRYAERPVDPYAGRRRDWGDDDDDWDDRPRSDDGYRGRKRKSLLSEIFDF